MENRRILVKAASILLLTLLILLNQHNAKAQSAEEIITKVQQQVATNEPLRVKFQQIFEWKVTGKVEKLNGEMVLEGLRKFRIATPDQTIVSNGETMWTYSRLENQVIIDTVRRSSQTIMPRDILFTYPEQYKATLWRPNTPLNSEAAVALKLLPKEKEQFLRELKVWVSRETWQPLQVEFTDLNENTTKYRINSVRIDSTISDKIFIFEPANDTEVIDVRP